MNPRVFRFLRPSYDGPAAWLWVVGAARIAVLLIVAVGGGVVSVSTEFGLFLAAIYGAALISSLWYLLALRREYSVSARLTWTQMFVDFGVVAVTISVTSGHGSVFTSLLVVVILEAGVLMGLFQGFLFACLSSAFMLFHFFGSAPLPADPVMHWYNFLIQAIAFFFTAVISGYWNQRVSRMKQFQREILDNMNSGFLITDTKGIVLAVNKAACQILNLVAGDVAGRHIEGIMRPESGAECPLMTALRLHKDFSSYEFRVNTGQEAPKLLGLTTSRMRDARAHETGIIASFTDLTEMARMRNELQKQDRMAAIGELSAGLAHEIRNPVASIRGAVAELRRSLNAPEIVDRLTAIALRESDHLNEIVSGFLDFARNPDHRREQVDCGIIAAEIKQQLEMKYAHAPGLRIVLQLPETPCRVLGDPTQIRQVFSNIAQNGIEAMDERGCLTISVAAAGSAVETRFDDEGPGIAPDKVARIFEPFYTEREQGVGMGLAICMRIVTTHDGTIHAASRPGGGTSMIVRLPAMK